MRDLDNSYPDLAAMRVDYGAGPFDSEGAPVPAPAMPIWTRTGWQAAGNRCCGTGSSRPPRSVSPNRTPWCSPPSHSPPTAHRVRSRARCCVKGSPRRCDFLHELRLGKGDATGRGAVRGGHLRLARAGQAGASAGAGAAGIGRDHGGLLAFAPARLPAQCLASRQSRPIASRAELDRALAETTARFAGVDEIPVPPHWGGYLLRPDEVEFWQGRQGRLHNRIRVNVDGDTMTVQRLQP